MKTSKYYIAIIVGHSLESQGAVNGAAGMTEYRFNSALADKLAAELQASGHDTVVLLRKHGYRKIIEDVNATGADIAISLHCNAFNTKASGAETLYWNSSSKGLLLAKCVLEEVVRALGNINRGTKPIKSGDRGAPLLKGTTMPCIIAEPFFIDNDTELANASAKKGDLITAYANGVSNYLASLQ
jgi:N-acetylmuramoyl-L-alanine amidase